MANRPGFQHAIPGKPGSASRFDSCLSRGRFRPEAPVLDFARPIWLTQKFSYPFRIAGLVPFIQLFTRRSMLVVFAKISAAMVQFAEYRYVGFEGEMLCFCRNELVMSCACR